VARNPHFSFPFQRGADGKVEVVEQDSPEHIMSCEHVIVRCPLGFRFERPEFGWPMPLFGTAPLDPAGLEAALRKFGPRSDVRASEWADEADAAVRHIEGQVGTNG
jgi:hypothetical protein